MDIYPSKPLLHFLDETLNRKRGEIRKGEKEEESVYKLPLHVR